MMDRLRLYERVRQDRNRLHAQTVEQARVIRQLKRERDLARCDALLLAGATKERDEALADLAAVLLTAPDALEQVKARRRNAADFGMWEVE